MVTGCKSCPSLIVELNSLFCEKTGEEYHGDEQIFLRNCPLSEARRVLMDTGLNLEERMMISGINTMNGLYKEV